MGRDGPASLPKSPEKEGQSLLLGDMFGGQMESFQLFPGEEKGGPLVKDGHSVLQRFVCFEYNGMPEEGQMQ